VSKYVKGQRVRCVASDHQVIVVGHVYRIRSVEHWRGGFDGEGSYITLHIPQKSDPQWTGTYHEDRFVLVSEPKPRPNIPEVVFKGGKRVS